LNLSLRLEVTTPEMLPEILSLLREAYRAPADSPNLQSRLLRWKYYDAGPPWEGSRSYVLRKEDDMVAHASVWPIRLTTPSGASTVMRALDWASAVAVPGAGVMLMRKLEGMAAPVFAVGGSEDTLRVLPKIGFQQKTSFTLYARVLRPWRQSRTRPAGGRKAIPRLLRNAAWSRSPLAAVGGWASQPAPPSAGVLSALDAQPADPPESRHSVEFLEFMLRCPAAQVRHFLLLNQGRPQGFFMLARVGGQTRLADLRILGQQPEDWSAAYSVATRTALQDAEACELVAVAPVPLVARALEANGFRRRGSLPVLVRDPQGLLAGVEHIHLSMLDDDSAFLNFPEHPYAT
jgi:hypothetical protein